MTTMERYCTALSIGFLVRGVCSTVPILMRQRHPPPLSRPDCPVRSCQEVVSDIRAKVDRVFEGFEEYLYLHKKLQSVLKGNKEMFQYRTRKRRREDDET